MRKSSAAKELCSEDKEHGTEQADHREDVIEGDLFLEKEDRNGNEHRERDGFLHNLELRDRENGVPEAVCRHLDEILKERDAPADECGDEPRLGREIFKMAVPCYRHKDIADGQRLCESSAGSGGVAGAAGGRHDPSASVSGGNA